MSTSIHGERMLTELDFARLSKLHGPHPTSELADLLTWADVTSSRTVHADVITMYTRIELVATYTRLRQTLTVCYPGDAEPAAGRVSVLSPVGVSLLGLKVGDTAKWKTPQGNECTADVEAILFQPEAAGDYLK